MIPSFISSLFFPYSTLTSAMTYTRFFTFFPARAFLPYLLLLAIICSLSKSRLDRVEFHSLFRGGLKSNSMVE